MPFLTAAETDTKNLLCHSMAREPVGQMTALIIDRVITSLLERALLEPSTLEEAVIHPYPD